MCELKQETEERLNDCAKLKVVVPFKSPNYWAITANMK